MGRLMGRPRVRHGFVVWAAMWRIRVLHELHYRANLAINLAQVVIDLAIAVVTIRLVFANVDALHGWTEHELLVVLGTFTIVDAVVRAVVLPAIGSVTDDVREGTFDAVLLMPADEQLVVTARELQLWDLPGALVGGAIAAYGASHLEGIGVVEVVGYLALLPLAVAIVYGFLLAVVSLAFRLVDVNDLMFRLTQAGSYTGRWPLGIYAGWLRAALTVIMPFGLAVTIPAAALTGRLTWAWTGAAVAGTVAVLVSSRAVFRHGIRSYSGASA